MRQGPFPTVILGGSDRRPTELPPTAHDKHPLAGYKGADIRFGGRPLVGILIERLDATGRFGPIYIAGPVRVYRGIAGGATVIDTDGNFAENIRNAMEHVRASHPGSPIAFITCDVLPEVETLRNVTDEFDRCAPWDLADALVRVPEDRSRLGAFAWKPTYRIAPEAGEPAVEILPGHLTIVDPEAIRLDFIYNLFQLGYRTRNRPIAYRLAVMLGGLIGALLWHDVLHVFRLRLPTLTWDVLSAGVPAALRLRAGTITREGLERASRRIFVRHRHRVRHPERRLILPIVEGISLAMDLDTEEEARQSGGEAPGRPA